MLHGAASLLTLLVAAGVFPPIVERPGSEDAPAASVVAETPELLAIGAALRDARRSPDVQGAELAKRIVDSGPGALAATFDVLAGGRVPATSSTDGPQVVSEAQRAVLLAALARFPSAAARAHVDARVRNAGDDPVEAARIHLAAVHALGAIGSARDLQRIAAIAPHEEGDDQALTRDARNALRDAAAAILARDTAAWSAMPGVIRTVGRSPARALLDAVATKRDPRALDVLYQSVNAHPDLRPLATAAVLRVGPSLDPSLTRDFAAWMADASRGARREHKEGLLRGIGVLDDGTHAQVLIDALADEEREVREAAAWSLRRLTGFGYPATPEPWRAWLAGELRWNAREREDARDGLRARDPARVVAALRSYTGRRAWRESLAEDVALVLDRSEPGLRVLGCEVLEDLHALAGIRPLAALLAAPEERVRTSARRALVTITGIELPSDPMQALEALQLL